MKNILVIDDEEGIRENLVDLINDLGFLVDSACNGEDALKKVKNKKPDIIILDLKMPKISGIEVLRQLKKGKNTKDIYIIVFTVRSMKEEIKEIKRLGADVYLRKPVPLEILIKEIEKAVKIISK